MTRSLGKWGNNEATVYLPEKEIANGSVVFSHSAIKADTIRQAAADGPTPSRSSHNSLVGVLNRAAPQSRQTNTTGNVKTPGWVPRVGLEKWSVTSPVNSASFSDEHRGQDMTLPADVLRYRSCLKSKAMSSIGS